MIGSPRTPWADTVIYEAHLRGLTMRLQSVPERAARHAPRRSGTSDTIAHLSASASPRIELLPIHAFVHDRALVDRGLVNYWGYNTLAFFAPEPRYLATGTPAELKAAIKALHAAGIEVLLDVVYNHTCEGSELRADPESARAGPRRLLSPAERTTRATASTTPASATPSISRTRA